MVTVNQHHRLSSRFQSQVFAVLHRGTLLLCDGAINRRAHFTNRFSFASLMIRYRIPNFGS
jgi:hypothetical protein